MLWEVMATATQISWLGADWPAGKAIGAVCIAERLQMRYLLSASGAVFGRPLP